MVVEAIDEYLAVAEYCVNTTKPGSEGVYGFPAVLLLFSVVDALSNCLHCRPHSFGALKRFYPSLSDAQVRSLKKWFRDPSSHQAMIMPGTKMTLEEGEPFEFAGAEPSHVRLRPFLRLIKNAWTKFDKTRIAAQLHPKQHPKVSIAIVESASTAVLAPSGCYVSTERSS